MDRDLATGEESLELESVEAGKMARLGQCESITLEKNDRDLAPQLVLGQARGPENLVLDELDQRTPHARDQIDHGTGFQRVRFLELAVFDHDVLVAELGPGLA